MYNGTGTESTESLVGELFAPTEASNIVTTNLRFGDWNSIFGSETMTAALLDRLTGKGHILEFIGESYRFRQRLRQEEQSVESKTETG